MLKIKAQTSYRTIEQQVEFNAQENKQIVLNMMDQAMDLFNRLTTPGRTVSPNQQSMQAIMNIRVELGNLVGMLDALATAPATAPATAVPNVGGAGNLPEGQWADS